MRSAVDISGTTDTGLVRPTPAHIGLGPGMMANAFTRVIGTATGAGSSMTIAGIAIISVGIGVITNHPAKA
jgi:hypothetical protein